MRVFKPIDKQLLWQSLLYREIFYNPNIFSFSNMFGAFVCQPEYSNFCYQLDACYKDKKITLSSCTIEELCARFFEG